MAGFHHRFAQVPPTADQGITVKNLKKIAFVVKKVKVLKYVMNENFSDIRP